MNTAIAQEEAARIFAINVMKKGERSDDSGNAVLRTIKAYSVSELRFCLQGDFIDASFTPHFYVTSLKVIFRVHH